MARLLSCLSTMLIVGGPLSAAPPKELAKEPLRSAEAVNYAQHLVADVINPIREHYFRPVKGADLVMAALSALHETAQAPLPATLALEVQKADEREMLALITRTRMSLGDVESLRNWGALVISTQAIVKKLDSYSGLVRGEELRRGNGIAGEYGIGMEFSEGKDGMLQVKAVSLGGPAQKAGIRPGDRITHINGQSTAGRTLAPVIYRPNGEPALLPADGQIGQTQLTVERDGGKLPRKVNLAYESFRPESVLGVQRRLDNSWDYWVDAKNKLAYLRLATLIEGTSGELDQAMQELRSQGLRGLVLDLRWCPGGSLVESINVAGLLLGPGIIATTRSRDGNDKEYASDAEHRYLGFPIVALVNAETSGGAELVAAALQDQHRAAIAGQRTKGKASIQTMIALPVPGAGLKLTNGMFIRPSGKNLHRFPESKRTEDWGVRPDPDRQYVVSPDLSRQLREWWQLQALRPWSCNDALPLDDLNNDPQRQYALKILATLVK